MSADNQSPQHGDPIMKPNSPATEAVAEAFLDEQLAQARRSFRRAQMFGIASVVVTLGYMSFLTVTLYTKLLKPEPAAQFATHYLATYVHENGTALSEKLVAEVPALIAQIPDTALAKLPEWRAQLEARTEALLLQQSRELAPRVAQALDEFLDQNQVVIGEFLKAGQNPEAVAAIGEQLEKEVLATLHAKGADGQSALDKLALGVEALKECESKFNRLAYADDLTTEEKQLRRVIALILQSASPAAQS